MRILYAAMRHDPTNPDLSSGVDYNHYSEFSKYADEILVAGPYLVAGSFVERAIKRLYIKSTGKRYLKWNWKWIRRACRDVNKLEREWQPDVVFSIFPSNIAFYSGRAPVVFNTDTTFLGWQDGGAGFGDQALRVMNWIEKLAIQKSARITTFSEWCRDEIVARHDTPKDIISVLPMPCALPSAVVPSQLTFSDILREKHLQSPLRLLLVGRDYHRKGVDIALEVVQLLLEKGIEVKLKAVSFEQVHGVDHVQFVGPFRKSIPTELEQYANLYREAHLLIHPARFDPSPIAPAEAAAFGTPTISNNVGGISTSVAHNVSGIVLPGHSTADAYAAAIESLLRNPKSYFELCGGARKRFEREQNWRVAGQKLMKILESVVQEARFLN